MIKTAGIQNLVAEELNRAEQKMRQLANVDNDVLAEAIAHLVDAGGKRLRPIIALLTTRFADTDSDKAVSLAAAVEMLHTATLVHDDVIDNSLLRRGSPTLNAKWSPGATILTGDYMFARSAGFAAETDSVRIVKVFAHTLRVIVNGELQQLFNNGRNATPPTLEEYHERIYAKTASLFAASAKMGGILAKLSEENIHALNDYGYYLGMAFQVMDDILDFEGDEAVLGKPIASDLRQGIATLPVLHFLKAHPEHPLVLKAVAKMHPTDDEMQQVVAEIRTSGSLTAALNDARDFAAQSKTALASLPANQYRQALADVADYAVARDI